MISGSCFLWDQPGPAKGSRPTDAAEPMDVRGVLDRLHKMATHSNQDCRAQKGSPSVPPSALGTAKGDRMHGKPKPTDICRACKSQGHWAWDCPQCPKKYVGTVGTTETHSTTREDDDCEAINSAAPHFEYGNGWCYSDQTGNE